MEPAADRAAHRRSWPCSWRCCGPARCSGRGRGPLARAARRTRAPRWRCWRCGWRRRLRGGVRRRRAAVAPIPALGLVLSAAACALAADGRAAHRDLVSPHHRRGAHPGAVPGVPDPDAPALSGDGLLRRARDARADRHANTRCRRRITSRRCCATPSRRAGKSTRSRRLPDLVRRRSAADAAARFATRRSWSGGRRRSRARG